MWIILIIFQYRTYVNIENINKNLWYFKNTNLIVDSNYYKMLLVDLKTTYIWYVE